MGNVPCNCLCGTNVNPVQLDPSSQPLTHFERQLITLSKSQEKGCLGKPTETQASQSVPVITWDSDSEEEQRTSRQCKTAEFIPPTSESASTRSNLPEKVSVQFRRPTELYTSMVRKQELMSLVTKYTEKMLLRELPTSAYFVDYPAGRWVRNASGTIFFDDSQFPLPSDQDVAPKTPTYFLPDGRIYYGQANKNLQPQGTGILISSNPEFIYKGDFQDGLPNGIGCMEINDCHLEGYWLKGEFNKGFIRSSQFQYEGQFVNGKPSGEGHYWDKQHQINYKGKFQDGRFNGWGSYSTERFTYRGQFYQGHREGKGVMQFGQPTRIHRGKWSNDKYVTSNQ